jgi:DNA replication and repair protein RecF
MAAEGVAIAAARNETIALITAAIAKAPTAFPKALLQMRGEVEEKLLHGDSALVTEEFFQEKLRNNRYGDARSGRTQYGVHRSDFEVIHAQKNIPATRCSTGEQKALLLAMILAEARAKTLWKGSVPILLLDEVVAHLDYQRREALFEEIHAMKAQVWMTGTDSSLFETMQKKAQFLHVVDSKIKHSD